MYLYLILSYLILSFHMLSYLISSDAFVMLSYLISSYAFVMLSYLISSYAFVMWLCGMHVRFRAVVALCGVNITEWGLEAACGRPLLTPAARPTTPQSSKPGGTDGSTNNSLHTAFELKSIFRSGQRLYLFSFFI